MGVLTPFVTCICCPKTLFSFLTLQSNVTEVIARSAAHDFVLDTWFMLVVHYGKTIVEWRKAGYHLQEDQQAFRCKCTAWSQSPCSPSHPLGSACCQHD